MTDTPDHYDLPIQPVDYIVKNNLGFLEGNVIKYVTRHPDKGQELDIKKAINYCITILKTEYGIDAEVLYFTTPKKTPSPHAKKAAAAFNPEGGAVGLMEGFFRLPECYRRYENVH